MIFEDVVRSYFVLNKKELKTKDNKKIYYKLSLYNYTDDNFVSLFVSKDIYDKCVLNKTHKFICKVTLYKDSEPRIDISDIM